MTLPASLILDGQARDGVLRHIEKLKAALARTPAQNLEFAKITTMVVSEMINVLANKDVGEMGSEARGKAYLIALEDVSHWAVEAAQRGWYRGEYGSQYDYKWMPEPPVLREVALLEERKVRLAIKTMEGVLEAQPFVDTREECEARAIEVAALVRKIRRV